MAVPKNKISKSKSSSRCAANFKVGTPNLVNCPRCRKLIKSHQVCPNCGYYDGELIIPQEEEK